MSELERADMNVETSQVSDSQGTWAKIEGVLEGAASAVKQVYKHYAEGVRTGITDNFGKPLIFDSAKPREDISNIPGKPVLDFSTEAANAVVTEPRGYLDEPNVVTKGENQYHDRVYTLNDRRTVIGDQRGDHCTVGVDGRVETMTTKTGGPGHWERVTREFKYNDSGELSSFSEKGVNWKKAEDGTFVQDGSNPPVARADVSVDPESGVFRYTDKSTGDKVSMSFDGRTFTEKQDGRSVETNARGDVLYMGFPPSEEFPQGRRISMDYDSDGKLTSYIENGQAWKRHESGTLAKVDQFVLEGSNPPVARTVPKIDPVTGKFHSQEMSYMARSHW